MNASRDKLRIFITFRDMKRILSNIKHVKHNLTKNTGAGGRPHYAYSPSFVLYQHSDDAAPCKCMR
jgi:hypothetical protein